MEQDQDKGGAGGVCDVPVAMGLSLHAMALSRSSFCMIGHSPVRLLTQIALPPVHSFVCPVVSIHHFQQDIAAAKSDLRKKGFTMEY